MGGAAAVVLIRERQIVEAFERAHATSPENGAHPTDLDVEPNGAGWRRLRSRAVVRETSPDSGKFYLDVEVWQALRRTRHRVIGVIIAVTLLALAFGIGPWAR